MLRYGSDGKKHVSDVQREGGPAGGVQRHALGDEELAMDSNAGHGALPGRVAANNYDGAALFVPHARLGWHVGRGCRRPRRRPVVGVLRYSHHKITIIISTH